MLRKQFHLAFLLMLPALCATGQQSFSVGGVLLDPSGAVVVGAPIRVEKPSGILIAQTQSDAKGLFQFSKVPAGSYSLIVPAYLGLAARSIPLHVNAPRTQGNTADGDREPGHCGGRQRCTDH